MVLRAGLGLGPGRGRGSDPGISDLGSIHRVDIWGGEEGSIKGEPLQKATQKPQK